MTLAERHAIVCPRFDGDDFNPLELQPATRDLRYVAFLAPWSPVSDEAAMHAVVAQYFRYLDTENWNGMREIWHEDGQLRAVGARPRENRDGVIEYFAKVFASWPEHKDRPVRVVVSAPERVVTANVQFIGTTQRGHEVIFDAVDVFDIATDGRILHLSSWYDIDLARKMIAEPGLEA